MFHLKNLFILLSLKIKFLGKNRKKIPKPSKTSREGISSPLKEGRSGAAGAAAFCGADADRGCGQEPRGKDLARPTQQDMGSRGRGLAARHRDREGTEPFPCALILGF